LMPFEGSTGTGKSGTSGTRYIGGTAL
jgi:hypothetical protein